MIRHSDGEYAGSAWRELNLRTRVTKQQRSFLHLLLLAPARRTPPPLPPQPPSFRLLAASLSPRVPVRSSPRQYPLRVVLTRPRSSYLSRQARTFVPGR